MSTASMSVVVFERGGHVGEQRREELTWACRSNPSMR